VESSDEEEEHKTQKAKDSYVYKKKAPSKDEDFNPRDDSSTQSYNWKNPRGRAIATSSLDQGIKFWVLFRFDIPKWITTVRDMTVEQILKTAVGDSTNIFAEQIPPPPNFMEVFPETIIVSSGQVLHRWGTSPLNYFAVYLLPAHYEQIIPANERSRPYNYNNILDAYDKYFKKEDPAPCILDPAVVGTLTPSRYASLNNVDGRGTDQNTIMGIKGINDMAMDMWGFPTANRPEDLREAEVSGICLNAMRSAPRHGTLLMFVMGFSGLTELRIIWAPSTTLLSIPKRTTFKPLNREGIWCSRPSRLTQCLCGELRRRSVANLMRPR
jgi:hypothetical protein